MIRKIKLMRANHFGTRNCLPAITNIEYTRHINKLMIIAEKPRVITVFLKNGSASTVPAGWVTGFFASSLLKKTKSRKARLQIRVKREKKEITFIN